MVIARSRAVLLASAALALICSIAAAAEPVSATTTPPAVAVAEVAPGAAHLGSLLQSTASALPPSATDVDRAHAKALEDFYRLRGQPLWIANGMVTEGAKALARELANANAYGLEARAFKIPDVSGPPTTDDATIAAFDVALTRAAMLYAHHARGGRIASPSKLLNSNLDRKPQLLAPDVVLARLADAAEPDAALRGFHPPHPQFEKLRQAYLQALPNTGRSTSLSRSAKKLRANMEMWRWMWDNLGTLHVFNNIPEFMQYVYKDGQIIRSERIVAGFVDKQSSVFSRPLQHVVLRPKWRVPESIMVHELWPSLLRGGGMMRQHGLEIETKSGEARNWRTIDWSKDDIRNYVVTQAPGPRSALGYVKFSFPSQHTIFMHDTPDKWMFKSAQRTLSHGCLRVRNPLELAEIVLAYDKGWDAAKVSQLIKSGPLNNEIAIEKPVPIHLAYFTAWVEDSGRLKVFYDVYGHEKRVIQALDGDWDSINKGRDHLAPVQPNFNPAKVAERRSEPQRKGRENTVSDLISNAMGGNF